MDATPLGLGKLPVELLGALLASQPVLDPSVVVGPGVGRDAAVVEVGGELLVVKSDPITFATDAAPFYLVNINANDLACLGARPRWMLVTALFPADSTRADDVGRLFADLQAACADRSIALVGGHTEVTDAVVRPVLVGHLIGIAPADRVLHPGGARPGDRLLLTRGIAIEGTALLARDAPAPLSLMVGTDLVKSAARLLHEPGISIADDADTLLDDRVVSALHDPTEGGVAMGIREMAEASGCGAVVSRAAIPLFAETRAISASLDLDPLGMLASGSLLAAVPADRMEAAERACHARGVPFAWIGKLLPPERGFLLRDGGDEGPMPVFTTDEIARGLAELAKREGPSA